MIARISTIDDQITFELLFNPLTPKSPIKQFQHLTTLQHPFNKLSTTFMFSTMLDDLFKHTKHLVQQSVECKLEQMLKPFKWALRVTSMKIFLTASLLNQISRS